MFPAFLKNPYNLESDLHFRKKKNSNYYGYDPTDLSYNYMKVISLTKWMKQLGFDGSRNKNLHHGFWIDDLAPAMTKLPLLELLYKAKKYSIIRGLNKRRVFTDATRNDKVLVALKIAIRHKYFNTDWFNGSEKEIISKVSDWVDLVEQVIELGLDYHNPHFVCPKSVYDDHMYYTRKINQIKEDKERVRELNKAKKMEESYIKARKCYFPLEIKDDVLTIKVLPNVESFYNEGMNLKHCVYGSEYFNMERKPDSLILSARIGENWDNPDKYVETIEVNLNDYSVTQSRGMQNQPSKYHNRIMRLLYSNIDKIIACEKEGEKEDDENEKKKEAA